MRMSILKLIASAGLFLSVQASEAGAQIFQWTDAKGVIHFTDNPHSIPESVRNSSALIVRKDLDSTSNSSIGTAEPFAALPNPSATNPPDIDATEAAPTVIYAPQEVNIVVVDSHSRRPQSHACQFGANCKAAFRPQLTDRRYIHPDGGSRQYIHPKSDRFGKGSTLKASR
jgi:hypothetical protein